MAFIPTPGVARVAILQSLHAQDVVNTLWFDKTSLGSIEPLDLSDLAIAIGGWWELQIAPLMSTDMSLVSVTATAQDSLIAPSVEEMTPASGTAVGSALPGSNCITVKFNTAFRGRSARGRNYVSGIREADVIGNVVDADFAADLVTAYNTLVSAPPTGWNWVLVSHYTELEPREEGVFFDILSASIVDRNVDSQRRRLTGRGS